MLPDNANSHLFTASVSTSQYFAPKVTFGRTISDEYDWSIIKHDGKEHFFPYNGQSVELRRASITGRFNRYATRSGTEAKIKTRQTRDGIYVWRVA